MPPDKRFARTAGWIYLAVIVTGMFSYSYVPSHIDTHSGAAATVRNISASLPLYRWGALSELVMAAAFLLLPFALYRLLHQVSRNIALLMLLLVVVSVPVMFVNVITKLDVLSLLDATDLSRAFTHEQLNAQVMMHVFDYRNGMLVAQIFSGLWLLPFGYLVFKSAFLPRILGQLLGLGGLCYLLDFCGSLLFPGYENTTISGLILLPASFGEIGICLWLLIVGTSIQARQSNDVSTRRKPTP